MCCLLWRPTCTPRQQRTITVMVGWSFVSCSSARLMTGVSDDRPVPVRRRGPWTGACPAEAVRLGVSCRDDFPGFAVDALRVGPGPVGRLCRRCEYPPAYAHHATARNACE